MERNFILPYRFSRTPVACYLHPTLSPEQLKQLRSELKCTARELAHTLGLEPSEVQAWETGERFPTKRRIKQLESLRVAGTSAIQRKPSGAVDFAASGLARLADPEFWCVVRKLAAHPQLFTQVAALTEQFDDPAPSSRKG